MGIGWEERRDGLFIFKKEEKFRQELRTWLEENLPQGWLHGDRELPEDINEYSRFLRDWQRKLYEGGWGAIAWPKAYGGREASLIEEIIYQQEMVRVSAPPLVNYVGIHMVALCLCKWEVANKSQLILLKSFLEKRFGAKGILNQMRAQT